MAGELINFANYKSLVRDGSSWVGSYSMTDTSKTIIMCAPSFRIVCEANSVLFRNNWITLSGSYWNGSTWVSAFSDWRAEASHISSDSFSFNHNREAESTDAEDNPHYHIWKLVVTMKGVDGSAHSSFGAWWGGIEMMTENEYNEVCQGKVIRGCKPECYTIDSSSMFDNVDECVANILPANYRGMPAKEHYDWMCATSIPI